MYIVIYDEILSAARSLSEAERQSLVQALKPAGHCEATVPESSRLLAVKKWLCKHSIPF